MTRADGCRRDETGCGGTTKMANDLLTVDFAGEMHRIAPTQALEFGRGAELNIDSNRFLHRRAGRFQFQSGIWFLVNLGRSMHLSVIDDESLSQMTLAPGRECALTFLPATVRFRAGPTTYELLLDGGAVELAGAESSVDLAGTATDPAIPLTLDQRLLIIALAELALREPAQGTRVPTTRQAAERLSWTLTRFNRKLDNVCAKLTKAGVAGLRGAPSALASGRRYALVDFAVSSGLVTLDDLALLESP